MANHTALLAGAAGLILGGGAMALAGQNGGFLGGDRAEVERIVRDYLLANPEVIPEAMTALEDRRLAKAVATNREALETPFGDAWAGAEAADVVLVQFFDYACGFCRKSNDDIDRLLAEDDRLKIVWRELPVLGPDSEVAARASLAAAKAGRFRAFHARLFELGRPSSDNVTQARVSVGVEGQAPAADAELARNLQLAQAIGATGTPTFVVGDKVLQGAVGYEALKRAVAEARAS